MLKPPRLAERPVVPLAVPRIAQELHRGKVSGRKRACAVDFHEAPGPGVLLDHESTGQSQPDPRIGDGVEPCSVARTTLDLPKLASAVTALQHATRPDPLNQLCNNRS
jgi:hypothetical protein